MGIFRKAAHKLHIKGSGRHSTTGQLKHEYESEPISEEDAAVPRSEQSGNADPNHQPTSAQAQVQDAQRPEVQDKSKVGPARLDLEHAPKAPPWAKKGLDANTTYTLHSSDDDPSAAVQQQSSKGQASGYPAGDQSSVQQAQRDQRAASVVPDGATKQSPAEQSGGTVLQPGFIGSMLVLVWVFLTLIYIQLFKISLLGMILPFLLLGMPTGLGLSWLFFYQLGSKKKISAQVSMCHCAAHVLTLNSLGTVLKIAVRFVMHDNIHHAALHTVQHHVYHTQYVMMHVRMCCVSASLHQLSVCAAEHHTWAEGPCAAHWRCALLDQLPGKREGQGVTCRPVA